MEYKIHEDYPNYIVDSDGAIYSKIKGSDNGIGYRVYKLTDAFGIKKYVLGHRFNYEANFGKIPEGLEIHHINHERSDNSILNLEAVTKSQNVKLSYNWRKSLK